MAFGAHGMAPFRLRASDTDGWRAERHARYCADLVASKRAAPFAWLSFAFDGSSIKYTAASDSVAQPTITVFGGSGYRVEWQPSYNDAYGMVEPLVIRHAKVTAHWNGGPVAATYVIENGRRLFVTPFNPTSGSVSLAPMSIKVWASTGGTSYAQQVVSTATTRPEGRPVWSHDADIGDYGGDPDKRNTDTEDVPYSWVWYRELGGMLGSAFTGAASGEVHAKKLALARSLAGVDRAAERARNNGLPGTADESLGQWLRALGITPAQGERRWQLRRKAAAKFAAVTGPTKETIDAAISDLLGDWLVQIVRPRGPSLSSPPALTHWPGVNPGPSSYDLGGGAWLSERSHLLVVVRRPSDAELTRFLQTMNVDLAQLLDRLLPGYATHGWATSDGFMLDLSAMDYDGMTT